MVAMIGYDEVRLELDVAGNGFVVRYMKRLPINGKFSTGGGKRGGTFFSSSEEMAVRSFNALKDKAGEDLEKAYITESALDKMSRSGLEKLSL